MPDEKTFSVRFRVLDDGSIVLDKISGKLADMGKKGEESIGKISSALSVMKYDAVVNLAERAYQAGQRVYEFARSVADSANQIDRMSKIAGLSSDLFQKFQYAAKMSDVSTEELAVGMKRLSANMSEAAQGQGKANEAFTAMKIKVEDMPGHLKPFDQIMKEIADKFSQWEDGPNKIALALALFGRSGEALIPMLNKGRAGIEAYFNEAEKLKVVLDPNLVAAGSRAEDAFKRLGARWDAMKLGAAGVSEKFANIATSVIDSFEKIQRWIDTHPILVSFLTGGAGLAGPLKKWLGGEGESSSASWWAALEKYGEHKPAEKAPAPAMQPVKYTGPESKDILAAWEAIVQKNEELYQIYAANNEQLYISNDRLREINVELGKAESIASEWTKAGGFETFGYESMEGVIKGYAEIEGHMYEIKELQDAITIGSASWVQDWVKNSYKMNDAMKTTEDIAAGIGNQLVNALGNAAHGFTNFAATVKNLGLQILSMIEQMILKMAIFGSITGEKNKETGTYGGLVGLFTNIISTIGGKAEGGITGGLLAHYPVKAYQYGGIATGPQLGIFGEAGEEAFVPLKGGKIPVQMMGDGRGGVYIENYTSIGNIEATDVESFEKKYGPSVNKIQKASARRGGAARKTMKAYL